MQVRDNTQTIAKWASVAVTVAVLGKSFTPFYWFGSTVIFASVSALGTLLVAMNWRPLRDDAGRIMDVLSMLVALYGLVIASFFLHSRPAVPLTYLLGILIFNGLFLAFGLAAARALKPVLLVLLGAAVIYSIILVQHAVRFGDVMRGLSIDDVFGIGNGSIYSTMHQNIGLVLGLGALAALGLASSRIQQILGLVAIPIVMLLLFHIAARAALVALIGSVVFWALADCWVRSKSVTILSAAAIIIVVTVGSVVFYQQALRGHTSSTAVDAVSRTVRELQDPDPGFRLPMWTKALHEIASEPDRLLFGRGIGMYPVNEGFGAPDWLLHKTEGSKHYLHNIHLEMLYETGITGLLLFSILTLFPLCVSIKRWQSFSLAQKSVVSMYVFHLASSEFSGAFAFSYLDNFFFALTVGIIALKRIDDVVDPSLLPDDRRKFSATVLSRTVSAKNDDI